MENLDYSEKVFADDLIHFYFLLLRSDELVMSRPHSASWKLPETTDHVGTQKNSSWNLKYIMMLKVFEFHLRCVNGSKKDSSYNFLLVEENFLLALALHFVTKCSVQTGGNESMCPRLDFHNFETFIFKNHPTWWWSVTIKNFFLQFWEIFQEQYWNTKLNFIAEFDRFTSVLLKLYSILTCLCF